MSICLSARKACLPACLSLTTYDHPIPRPVSSHPLSQLAAVELDHCRYIYMATLGRVCVKRKISVEWRGVEWSGVLGIKQASKLRLHEQVTDADVAGLLCWM